tara:strand:+ start:3231 stop:3842 length:612 start_codon:yes stop_codon:yes gene_type:complete
MNKEFKYKLIKNVISKNVLQFIHEYFLLKRRVFRTLLKEKIIPPYLEHLFGQTEDLQVLGTDYTMYADIVSETLLKQVRSIVQKETDFGRVVENYSYVRIYKKGNVLKKHTDRNACKLSVTLPVGGNEWPMFVDGKQFILEPGDLLIYDGSIPHWREPLQEAECVQIFLHYNTVKQLKEKNMKAYDNRLHLGLPAHTSLGLKK